MRLGVYHSSTFSTSIRKVRQFVHVGRRSVHLSRTCRWFSAISCIIRLRMPLVSQSCGLRQVFFDYGTIKLIRKSPTNKSIWPFLSVCFAVMEVASGEYGEAVPTLVMAVNSHKNANTLLLTENEIGIQLQGISKNIANDISKSNDKPKIRTPASSALTKNSNVDHTLINLSNNDDLSSQNKASTEVCTTSLLDSHDSVVTLPNKHTFPTSGWKQFWILLKRAFKTILRDKQLMHMRLAAHVIVGTIIGMIYYDIGGEASKVYDNLGCTFFTMLFTMFTGMMPTILTCTRLITSNPHIYFNLQIYLFSFSFLFMRRLQFHKRWVFLFGKFTLIQKSQTN